MPKPPADRSTVAHDPPKRQKAKASPHLRAQGVTGQGVVAASTAILRAAPGGAMIARLPRGTPIAVKAGKGDWVEVAANGMEGVLSRRRFRLGHAPAARRASRGTPSGAPAMPPDAGPGDIKVVGSKVLGPNGIVFGKIHKLGLVNYGRTGLDTFFDEDPDAFPDLSPSVQRVMRAVSANEGKIEAINTWDNSILSCSIYQWTVAAGTGAGELPYALSVLKERAPAAFATYFGSLGLDVAVSKPKPFAVGRGHFILHGRTLDTEALKAPLRGHLWAYRFWRAAHDAAVRRAYVRVAIDRIPVFYGPAVAALDGRTIGDFMSSEEAVAHLLDQHVNRPGHVPQTIAAAITAVIAATGKSDPAGWSDAEERATLAHYLELRRGTSMTDSDGRAQRIKDVVRSGRLSDRRGSFHWRTEP
ncbi:hypothetical protein AAFN86_27055 [Roseomonas sp. CAU 1739]|uniref:hypothetical protein n=1 Tax=Roseomonas sp. CAU 1739 TaxID=3140364 RepID=UPI00325B5F27